MTMKPTKKNSIKRYAIQKIQFERLMLIQIFFEVMKDVCGDNLLGIECKTPTACKYLFKLCLPFRYAVSDK